MRVFVFGTKNRLVALLVGLLVLGAGVAFLLLATALLAGVAIAGGVLGSGLIAYRMLRGRGRTPLAPSSSSAGLDPSLEVFPESPALPRQARAEPNDEHRSGPA